jgi:hypothetical protein
MIELAPLAIWAGSELLKELGQRQEADAQAAQLRRNADLADRAAADALQRGEQKAWRVRMTGERRMSLQKVAYAHAGVDVSSGTPLRAMSETAMVTALDAQVERNNAFREAWGYRKQAANMRAGAEDLGNRTDLLSLATSKEAWSVGLAPVTGGLSLLGLL